MLVLLGWRRSNGDRYKDAFAVPEVLVGANAYPVPRLLHTRLNAGHNPLEDLAIAVLLGTTAATDQTPTALYLLIKHGNSLASTTERSSLLLTLPKQTKHQQHCKCY
mmetsp:Transcript_19394/g.44987  ORF Transcript_19394/g.44987 Transcript_19394/m.44987 type:complete len:107 (-) Transcript_19394:254-574(-)